MSLDLPRVEYSSTDLDKKEKKNPSPIDMDAVKSNEEALRQRKNKQSNWKPIKLSDLNTNTN